VLPGENIGIYVSGQYQFYRVPFVEAIPSSRQMTQNLGVVGANASSGGGTPTQITVTDVPDGYFGHFRWMPIDDAEIELFESLSVGRYATLGTRGRVNVQTGLVDPTWASTTIGVFGAQRSAFMLAWNIAAIGLTQSRIKFWGYKYTLVPFAPSWNIILHRIAFAQPTGDLTASMTPEQKKQLADFRATLVPAEGFTAA